MIVLNIAPHWDKWSAIYVFIVHSSFGMIKRNLNIVDAFLVHFAACFGYFWFYSTYLLFAILNGAVYCLWNFIPEVYAENVCQILNYIFNCSFEKERILSAKNNEQFFSFSESRSIDCNCSSSYDFKYSTFYTCTIMY